MYCSNTHITNYYNSDSTVYMRSIRVFPWLVVNVRHHKGAAVACGKEENFFVSIDIVYLLIIPILASVWHPLTFSCKKYSTTSNSYSIGYFTVNDMYDRRKSGFRASSFSDCVCGLWLLWSSWWCRFSYINTVNHYRITAVQSTIPSDWTNVTVRDTILLSIIKITVKSLPCYLNRASE